MISSFTERIEDAYERLGHQLGWRFLASPARTLSPETRLAFVGLNPGGSRYEAPSASVEEGNAYRIERWGADGRHSKLQLQMLQMYRELAREWPGSPSVAELMDETLAANFCPFRSPSWERLANRPQSIGFSRSLWADVFEIARPHAVICFGEVERQLAEVLEASGLRLVEPSEVSPAGWGAVTYSLSRYESARGRTLLVRLPHLSRFGIFGRPQSRQAVSDLTGAIVQATVG